MTAFPNPSSPLTICVPVLRRYDLLKDLLRSIAESWYPADVVLVVDNGGQGVEPFPGLRLETYTPRIPMGVAESWNWFLREAPEERIIVNDDVTFAPDSLGRIVATPGDLVSSIAGNAFSCFLIRDSCVAKIGTFDETISPGYAYYEDCDYAMRMFAAGFDVTHVECGVSHGHSQTFKATPPDAMEDHHRRFAIAHKNFVRKWGRTPQQIVADGDWRPRA